MLQKLTSIATSLFGSRTSRIIKELTPTIEAINALEPVYTALSNDEMRLLSSSFRAKISEAVNDGKTEEEALDELIPDVFAAVRESARRTMNERHFDVQLIGGLLLYRGMIAEMRTGEGKTLVATLPAYARALLGKGVHVVTVNDYLSRRDGAWMGQVYSALGMTVGVLNNDSSYVYDASHSTSALENEQDTEGSFRVVYEFLRPCSRREAYEADITYGTNNEFGFDYLRDNLEYDPTQVRQRDHAFAIVDEIDSILIDEARTPLIISAPAEDSGDLYAKFATLVSSFSKDIDYEVDEKLKATTLTARGIEKAEKMLGLEHIYTDGGVHLVRHLETAIRAKALFQRDRDYVVKDGAIVIVDEFTGRLQPGRRWSEGLHQAIEAKEGVMVQKESRTLASITFQNYFRMYKKVCGMTGTAETSAEEFYKVYGLDVIPVPTHRPIARRDHNDLIFQTEKGKWKAVARKVKELHTKGQPVLIGTVSIERNELLSAYLLREGVPHHMLNAKNHEKEGEIIAQAGRKGAVTIATNMAGRGVDIKLGGLPFNQTAYEEIKNIGGLFVLGTERHEARRIDNQLRGRAGRQGDPGETQFFVSLEDDLMRVFAADTVKNIMSRLQIPEDEAIENPLVSRALETAQSKIEGVHFDARKHVLDYDDVLNQQRASIYRRRRALLIGENLIDMYNALVLSDDEKQMITEKRTAMGDQVFFHNFRHVMLHTIDMLWIEHLEAMEYLRNSVNLRAYGQRDPLVEYKKEGLHLFRTMLASIDRQVIDTMSRISEVPAEPHVSEQALQAMRIGTVVNKTIEHLGRNDKIIVVKNGEEKEVKVKKADALIKEGWSIKQ